MRPPRQGRRTNEASRGASGLSSSPSLAAAMFLESSGPACRVARTGAAAKRDTAMTGCVACLGARRTGLAPAHPPGAHCHAGHGGVFVITDGADVEDGNGSDGKEEAASADGAGTAAGSTTGARRPWSTQPLPKYECESVLKPLRVKRWRLQRALAHTTAVFEAKRGGAIPYYDHVAIVDALRSAEGAIDGGADARLIRRRCQLRRLAALVRRTPPVRMWRCTRRPSRPQTRPRRQWWAPWPPPPLGRTCATLMATLRHN